MSEHRQQDSADELAIQIFMRLGFIGVPTSLAAAIRAYGDSRVAEAQEALDRRQDEISDALDAMRQRFEP